MTRKLTIAVAALTVAVGLQVSPAFADGDGVKVGGMIVNTVVVRGNVTNIAGTGGKAVTSVGTIHEGFKANGSTKTTVYVDNVVNVAGPGRTACTRIGSYGPLAC